MANIAQCKNLIPKLISGHFGNISKIGFSIRKIRLVWRKKVNLAILEKFSCPFRKSS